MSHAVLPLALTLLLTGCQGAADDSGMKGNADSDPPAGCVASDAQSILSSAEIPLFNSLHVVPGEDGSVWAAWWGISEDSEDGEIGVGMIQLDGSGDVVGEWTSGPLVEAGNDYEYNINMIDGWGFLSQSAGSVRGIAPSTDGTGGEEVVVDVEATNPASASTSGSDLDAVVEAAIDTPTRLDMPWGISSNGDEFVVPFEYADTSYLAWFDVASLNLQVVTSVPGEVDWQRILPGGDVLVWSFDSETWTGRMARVDKAGEEVWALDGAPRPSFPAFDSERGYFIVDEEYAEPAPAAAGDARVVVVFLASGAVEGVVDLLYPCVVSGSEGSCRPYLNNPDTTGTMGISATDDGVAVVAWLPEAAPKDCSYDEAIPGVASERALLIWELAGTTVSAPVGVCDATSTGELWTTIAVGDTRLVFNYGSGDVEDDDASYFSLTCE